MKNDRRHRDAEVEGAMTGATGSLTPSGSDEEFVPAERREVMGGSGVKNPGERDAGAYIGREPELAAETIPGGVKPGDERVAATASESSGEGSAERRVQGGDDEWPKGHRDGEDNAPERQRGS
jgi:hypothetical protein